MEDGRQWKLGNHKSFWALKIAPWFQLCPLWTYLRVYNYKNIQGIRLHTVLNKKTMVRRITQITFRQDNCTDKWLENYVYTQEVS